MPYKVIRNCSDGVIGHLHRPGDIIEGHPQIETLLAKGTVRELDPEPEEVEAEEVAAEPEEVEAEEVAAEPEEVEAEEVAAEPEEVEAEEVAAEPEARRGRGRPKKSEVESDSGDEHSGEPDPLESE